MDDQKYNLVHVSANEDVSITAQVVEHGPRLGIALEESHHTNRFWKVLIAIVTFVGEKFNYMQ